MKPNQTKPKLVKNSIKNLIVPLYVNYFSSSLLAISRDCQPLINNYIPPLNLQNLCTAMTMVCPPLGNG